MNRNNVLLGTALTIAVITLSAFAQPNEEKSTSTTPTLPDTALNQPAPHRLVDPSEQLRRALSRRPVVTGEAALHAEAVGLRQLSPRSVQSWREGRLNF